MKRTRKSKSRPKKKEAPPPDMGYGLIDVWIDDLTPTDACVNIRTPILVFKADIAYFQVSSK